MPSCTHIPQPADSRPLLWSLTLTGSFMVLEVAGGLLSGSLALLSDAGHMLTDTGALGLSLFALWLSRRPADPKRTYGYYRLEILAALVNGAFLWVIVFFIFKEAVGRLLDPSPVRVGGMLAVGFLGLVVNLVSLFVLRHAQAENLNVRAAFLHVLGDALGSLGVLAAGAVILLTGWTGADPLAGMLIGLLILYSSWGLIREAVHILLEGSPSHLEMGAIRSAIMAVPGVDEVHDLHLWSLNPKVPLLSAHVVASDKDRDLDPLRRRIIGTLADRFCIEHTTIQMEGERCLGASGDRSQDPGAGRKPEPSAGNGEPGTMDRQRRE